MEEIIVILRLWFCAWLIFEVLRIVSVDVRKISSLLRGGDKKDG